MRAQKHVVLPDEDAVEFAALQTALFAELAPAGAIQLVLARQIAIAAWRLARADRMEVELFEQRRWDNGGVGVALIRDGNGTRSFETLLRYRSAATAEFMRALRTLKALQAEAAATGPSLADPTGPTPRPAIEGRRQPNEPERRPLHEYIIPDPPGAGRTLHEPAAPWMPNEPEAERPARLNQRQIPAEPPLVSRPQRLRSRERQVHAASCRTNRSALAGTNPGPDERAQAALLRRTPLPLVSIALLRGLKRA